MVGIWFIQALTWLGRTLLGGTEEGVVEGTADLGECIPEWSCMNKMQMAQQNAMREARSWIFRIE